jgi:hypothetical protein
MGKADAVWLTKGYRIWFRPNSCAQALEWNKSSRSGFDVKKSRRMSWIEQRAAQNAESEWSRLSPSRAAPTSNA